METPATTRDWVFVILPSIIAFIGVLGNTLSAIVLLRSRLRHHSFSFYLLALAILDSIFILSIAPIAWLVQILFGVNYQAYSDTTCQLSFYISAWSNTASAWVLVVLTVERMLAMSIPHIGDNFMSRRRAVISVSIVTTMVGLIYIFYFFMVEKSPHGGFCYWCNSVAEARLNVLLSILNDIVNMVIPSTIMATSNSVLLFLLYYCCEANHHMQTEEDKHMVVTIVCVTMAFLLLTAPMYLTSIVHLAGVKIDVPRDLHDVTYCLFLLRNATNFIFYSISWPTFRREIRFMFAVREKCRERQAADTSVASFASMHADMELSQISMQSECGTSRVLA